ncbi:MAG TPA: hypothetical protein VGZ00_07520 [Candidatus Baltobacteraceae bacterium]|nr:hypothetical protein [Candidatus Baltobacteraceae bacterium]
MITIGSSKGDLASFAVKAGYNGSDSAMVEQRSEKLATLLKSYDHISVFIEDKSQTIRDAYDQSYKAIKEAATSTDGFSLEQKDACCAFIEHVKSLLDDFQQRKASAATEGTLSRSRKGI